MAPGHQIKFSVRTLWTKLINWSLFSENWVQCIQEVEFMSQGKEADGLFSFLFLSSLSFLPFSFHPFLLSSRWILPLLVSSSPPIPPFPFLLGTNEKEERERKTWYCARAHKKREEINVKDKAKRCGLWAQYPWMLMPSASGASLLSACLVHWWASSHCEVGLVPRTDLSILETNPTFQRQLWTKEPPRDLNKELSFSLISPSSDSILC